MGTWAENARRQCQTLIPTAIQLLSPERASWPTVKAAIGFVRNIAHDKKNRSLLANQDLIPQLVKLLAMAENEIVTGSEVDLDGINMIDIAEGCTGALQIMARDSPIRERIRGQNIIPAVCVLLTIDHSNLQRSVTGFLCEMSADRASREVLYRENQRGGTLKDDLLALLQAESEATVAYSAITLVITVTVTSTDIIS